MADQTPPTDDATPAEPNPKPLTEAAKRALAEAEARRQATAQEDRPKEIGGRDGLEPVRYGDWEVKGRASDF
ncbi:DUF1674 domain-containing protein [Amorphus sp. 3PC139-8]|uniref:DUF1674 domain-containing protein n=1 Tax=Amorphus sp. 3PC139-8 TaxID=2735676 RepID=UPI00345D81A5